MKKINMILIRVRWCFILALFLSAFAATVITPKEALAVYNTKILDRNTIARLSDQQLIDYYIDVMVELEVTKSTGIYGPDLPSYKGLLKARIFMLLEFEKRKMEVPSAEIPK